MCCNQNLVNPLECATAAANDTHTSRRSHRRNTKGAESVCAKNPSFADTTPQNRLQRDNIQDEYAKTHVRNQNPIKRRNRSFLTHRKIAACVLPFALWVRSHTWMGTTGFIGDHVLESIQGRQLWGAPLNAAARPRSPNLVTYSTAIFGGTFSFTARCDRLTL